jgi:exonuclease SbcD
MKILLSPDLHCFYDNYGRVLPDGKHSRLVDWERTSSHLLQAAVDNEVELAVFPGDFFKNSRPAPEQIIAVSNLISSFASYDIEVVGCPGNHDLVGAGKPGPVDLVKAVCKDDMYVQITSIPDVFQVEDVNIAVLPSVKPNSLIDAADNPTELASIISQRLVEICRSLMVQCHEYEGRPRKNILIGHWTISGAVTSSGQLLYGGLEPVIPLTELQGMGWDAVLFGHIHKPQVLSASPFIGYAGALERVDFGEEDDPRGCYIIDTNDGSYQWVELPARKFWTIHANVDKPECIQRIYDRALGNDSPGYSSANFIKDSIVRVKYCIPEELAPMVDHSKIMSCLQTVEPEYIAGIFPEVERSERSRESSITEETGPVDALVKYLDSKGIDAASKENIVTIASKLLAEVIQ